MKSKQGGEHAVRQQSRTVVRFAKKSLKTLRHAYVISKKNVLTAKRHTVKLIRPVWRTTRHIVTYGVAVIRALVIFIVQLLRAMAQIILILPGLYDIYKQEAPETLRDKARVTAHITYHACAAKVAPISAALSQRLSAASVRLTGRKHLFKHHKLHHHLLRGAVVAAIILIAVANILLPAMQARADSLTWSSNADFAYNKISKCQPASLNGLTVSSAYTDATCATNGVDASLALPGGGTYITNIKAVAAGNNYTVALKKDGTVWTWGNNFYGQLGDGTNNQTAMPVQVKDAAGTGYLTGITAISTAGGSGYHTLALKNDGTMWAWGSNGSGQLGDGTTANRNLPVQVKDATGTGMLGAVTAIAGGGNHTVALLSDGTVWAWGYNNNGQLGDNTIANHSLPAQVRDVLGTGYLTGMTAIAAGGNHSIAVQNDGTVWNWGFNNYGQLGDNTVNQRKLPVQVKDTSGVGYLTGVTAVVGGINHTAAIKADGTVWAWGYNGYGQLGDNTTTNRLIPVQTKDATGTDIMTNAMALTAGGNQTAAVKTDGTLWAWGYNNAGQLGDNTITNRSLPVQVKDTAGTGTLVNIAGVAGGNAHVVAVHSDGTVWAWGSNQTNQLGATEEVARTSSRRLPAKVLLTYTETPLTNVKTIVAGSTHSMILKNDGTVWTWGSNGNGQLGDGTTTQRYLPVQVKDAAGTGYLTGVTAIAAGNSFTVALKSDGTVWAWGSNGYGQLGDNTTTQRNLPIQVKDAAGTGVLSGMTALAAGGSHTIAVKSDGTVWAWGYNAQGQLGDNTMTNRGLPVQVKDPSGGSVLTGVSTVTGGANHTVALKTDGTVWGWGYNFHGQVGDNTTTQRNLPVQVKDSLGTGYLTNVAAISSGSNSFHTLALKNDGTVWAWGNNNYGQLGDNTLVNRSLPIQVKDAAGTGFLTAVNSIAAGGNYTLVAKTDTTLWALGQNNNGQLGDSTTTNHSLPIQVKNSTGSGFITGGQAVAAGYYHSFMLKTDGSLMAWGWNSSGQFGNWSSVDSSLPTPALVGVYFTGGYATYGSASGYVFDAGDKRRAKWHNVSWNTDPLPTGTTVAVSARNSQDGATWSNWTDYTQSVAGTLTYTADLSVLPAARFIELKVALTTSGTMTTTPVVKDFTMQMLTDILPPVTNAGNIKMYHTNTSNGEIANGGWNNSPTPLFTWDPATDDAGGAGIAGYCLYLGQDNTADVTQTKGGFLGSSPQDSNGLCQYAVSPTSLDLSAAGVLATALPTSSSSYYLLVKAYDSSNNIYAGVAAQFAFKHDVTAPTNVTFVSLPGQFVSSKDVTMTWPTSGPDAASDANAGLAGIQYRIGAAGTWYGVNHNGNQDITDVLSASGSYQTSPTFDYPLLNDGNNMIYFRSIDNAGNVSQTVTTAVIKLNTASPSTPQALAVTPTTNTANNFAFTWQAPATYVGQAANITYCYTVNTLPTDATCTYTAAGQTNLTTGAYATQPGDNTFYVAAKDEAGNINYATAASTTFTANTSAPGIPLNVEIADVSVKSTASWKLALSWEAPTEIGAGVASYRVMRSAVSADTGFTQVATTQGNSYVDTNLNDVTYYYKIKACDTANNCGAETTAVAKLPTGRYMVAASIIGTPTVEVSTRKATIRWTTERNSDSRIQYGTESGQYQSTEAAVSEQTKVHSVELTGLEAGQTYYYRAKWTDEDGNIGKSGELMFTTLPAPVIKDATVVKKTLTGAIIRLTSTDATRVKLNYGKTQAFGGAKTLNTSLSESAYTIELDGLDDSTTYYLRPDATDADGYTYEGNVVSFTTAVRPKISDLRFQPVAGEPTSTQKITWATNVPATSVVTYGLNDANGTDVSDSKLTTDHSVLIHNLKDDSSYFLLAQSRDADGNLATSDRQNFRTALDTRPPVVSDINVETSIKGTGTDAHGQVVITWKTDEPTTSQVAYGQGTGGTYTNSTVDDTRLLTEHTVVISDLRTSSVYYLQPISRDGANNQTKGSEQSAIIGRPTDNVMTIILNALYRTFGL